MKEIRIVLDDKEHKEILKTKGEMSWKELLLSVMNKPIEQEESRKVKER